MPKSRAAPNTAPGLYTPDERARRDATVWTLIQGILAPLQFAVFLVSLALVVRYLYSGEGYLADQMEVVRKKIRRQDGCVAEKGKEYECRQDR